MEPRRFYAVVEFRGTNRNHCTRTGYMDANDARPVVEAVEKDWIPALMKREQLTEPRLHCVRLMTKDIMTAGMIDIVKSVEAYKKEQVDQHPILSSYEQQMSAGPSATESQIA